jgi:hypothetical protein
MVLVAAVACGLALSLSSALVLWRLVSMKLSFHGGGGPRRTADLFVYKIESSVLVLLAIVVMEWFLLPWLAAFVVIRLRRPRPALREAVRQPGTAAVLVVGGWLMLSAPIAMVRDAGLILVVRLLFVASVPTAWIALKWTGQWRPEPGWIDRLGRCLGIFFCLAVAGQLVVISLP